MYGKGASNTSPNVEPVPVISVRASPAHVDLSLSSTAADAAKISLEFTLHGNQPVTIFIYDTLLQPPPSTPSLIHRTFIFTDIVSGAVYKSPVVEGMRIIDYNDYMLSYTNADNFLTLYPKTPYVVDRNLWPKTTDGDSRIDPHNMEPGRSYRMQLPESSKREHLWWTWGPKWQVLRWRWWPFGAVKDVDDFVNGHKGWEELAEVEFVWEGDCVVHVAD